jgi:lysophospholipase L1-like esterase
LVLGSALLCFALLCGADRWLARRPEWAGLVLPPQTCVHYATDEFDCEVRSNALGFRGHLPAEPRRAWRIAAIGDSFTYGWGVGERETWPAVLEGELAGADAEVLNLGQGGVGTAGCAAIAERALPPLRPDLVLVGVLQADDLAQSLEAQAERDSSERAKAVLRGLFPGLVGAWRALRTPDVLEIGERWRADARAFAAGLGARDRGWYATLPEALRGEFEAGRLNPGLLSAAREHPDHLLHTLELDSPACRSAIAAMGVDLGRIRDAAAGAPVLVVCIPHPAFVCEANRETYRALGFRVDPRSASATEMDAAIARAAAAAGLRCATLTACMREAAGTRALFYPHDGHPNAEGQRQIAACLAPIVAEVLEQATPRAESR